MHGVVYKKDRAPVFHGASSSQRALCGARLSAILSDKKRIDERYCKTCARIELRNFVMKMEAFWPQGFDDLQALFTLKRVSRELWPSNQERN